MHCVSDFPISTLRWFNRAQWQTTDRCLTEIALSPAAVNLKQCRDLNKRDRCVSFGVIPRNVDHRSAATAPTDIVGSVVVATAIADAGVPFVERRRKLPNRELLRNRHSVLRKFVQCRPIYCVTPDS
jgi:hypothetical protein